MKKKNFSRCTTFRLFVVALMCMGASFAHAQATINVAVNDGETMVSAHYTWTPSNPISVINDGNAGGTHWHSWSGDRPATGWAVYEWQQTYTLSSVAVYFWTDRSEDTGWGDNVPVPESWKIQYWDETATPDENNEYWVDVTLLVGQEYTRNRGEFNTAEFNPVTTSKLRLFMNAQTNGSTYSSFGLTEWEVYAVYPSAIMDAYNALDKDVLLANTSEKELEGYFDNGLTLPTSLNGGVTVSWESSKPEIISSTGEVVKPEGFDTSVVLTATLTYTENDNVYKMKKTFTVLVYSEDSIGTIAKWNFSDETIYTEDGAVKIKAYGDNNAIVEKYTATLHNDARIRIIGEPENVQFNVLDLGNGTGYLDMGAEIGKAAYTFENFTISAYFRVDDAYEYLSSNGNYLFSFANTDNAGRDQNGYLIGHLNGKNYQFTCSQNYWGSGSQTRVTTAGNTEGISVPQGEWKHYLYTQEGNNGYIYIDGVKVAENLAMNLPSQFIPKEGLDGTNHNYIGRNIGQPSDVFLRQTLVYDFTVFNYPMDINSDSIAKIAATLNELETAYADNDDYVSEDLQAAFDALTLTGDLDNITESFTLPKAPNADISTVWESSNENIIKIINNADGSITAEVTRPKLYDAPVTLTVTVTKGLQFKTKSFDVLVASLGLTFANDLKVHYDFSQVDGVTITDQAEMNFKGSLMNDASILPMIAESGEKFNVLDLGNGTGYFDMGQEIGQIMYNTYDYTLSAFYYIDENYEGISNNGNFLWTFANAEGTSQYNIAILKDMRVEIRGLVEGSSVMETFGAYPSYQNAEKGKWTHFAYTQSGTVGTIYLDGMYANEFTITNIPAEVFPVDGLSGTLYNWIGRSNFTSDVYLRQTYVADFRFYSTALEEMDFEEQIDVTSMLEKLNGAVPTVSLEKVNADSPYTVRVVNGQLLIDGLQGGEKVSMYDIMGRQCNLNNQNKLSVSTGVYIVKIDNYATKIIVK